MRPRLLAAVLALLGPFAAGAVAQEAKAIRIDLDHIFSGRINRQGELVGIHHQPSAPKEMKVGDVVCKVEFVHTSPGGAKDVVTARVLLRDPATKKVLKEKSSTLFPAAWGKNDIEKAIREAFADAKSNNKVDKDGRWTGRGRGVRIDGYLSRDGKAIATAFPVYQKPKKGGKP